MELKQGMLVHLAGKLKFIIQSKKRFWIFSNKYVLTSQVYGGTGTDQNIVGMTGLTGYGTTGHTLTTSWQTFKVEGISIPTDRTQITVAFTHVPTGTAVVLTIMILEKYN